MRIRADFTRKESVRPGEAAWVASPQPGVERLMLDRIGEEVARATSLVRFAPGSFFPFHEHNGGEEIFIIEGVLQDEHGIYPAGTYLRNPAGTSHTPYSKEGCLLFVKLRQFARGDNAQVVIDTQPQTWSRQEAAAPATRLLHAFGEEVTLLMHFLPGTTLKPHVHQTGQELLVLEGTFSDESGDYTKGSWIRFPQGSSHAPYSVPGCTLIAKVGHLPPTRN